MTDHPAAGNGKVPSLAALDDELASVVEVLRDKLTHIETRIAELDEERTRLVALRRQMIGALEKLSPMSKPRRKIGQGAVRGRSREDKFPRVEAFIRDHAAELDNEGNGFAARNVYDAMRAHPDGEPVGDSIVRDGVRKLHETGVLRLYRIGPGGSQFFKLVSEAEPEAAEVTA